MNIVILGAAESGVGAALLAQAKGHAVFVSDRGAIQDSYKAKLTRAGIEFEENQHTEARILQADEVVKSPGIPEKAPIIQALREKNIPVISEIEFAGRYTKAKCVCITGTNGKTTTTLLTYHLLKSAGLNVGLAGNVGYSLAEQVIADAHDYYVVELSSFQLDDTIDFQPWIAVLLNITPDHLDRYGTRWDLMGQAAHHAGGGGTLRLYGDGVPTFSVGFSHAGCLRPAPPCTVRLLPAATSPPTSAPARQDGGCWYRHSPLISHSPRFYAKYLSSCQPPEG
jgi:UDP-N-acetylmuramate-alanine ligase